MADEAMQEVKCLLTTLIEYFSREKYQARYKELLTNLERLLENERSFVNDQALKQAKERASELKWDEESKHLPSTQTIWANLYFDIFHSDVIRYPGVFSALQEVSPLQIKIILAFGRICNEGKLMYFGNSKPIFRIWLEQVPQEQIDSRSSRQDAFLLGIDSKRKFHIIYF